MTGMTGLFMIASLFAFVFVVVLFATSPARQRSLHLALGLILAGALGNLYDRAFIKADILTFRSGERFIGKIIDQRDDLIQIGEWPGRGRIRVLPASRYRRGPQPGGRPRLHQVSSRSFPSWVPRVGGKDIWPWVFNIADSALVCGVGPAADKLLVRPQAAPPPPPEESPAGRSFEPGRVGSADSVTAQPRPGRLVDSISCIAVRPMTPTSRTHRRTGPTE